MATSFREWPWPLQALFYVGLAVVIVAAGFYVPVSPVRTVRSDLEAAQDSLKPLETEVQSLRVYKQRRAELQSEMDALQKQLATLQTIVPEEKQVDQFILMIQSAAISSGVSIRKLTAKPVARSLTTSRCRLRLRPTARITRYSISSRGWGVSRELSTWAI